MKTNIRITTIKPVNGELGDIEKLFYRIDLQKNDIRILTFTPEISDSAYKKFKAKERSIRRLQTLTNYLITGK